MTNTRRDFLQTLLAMGGAAAALGTIGCGDDDPAGEDGGADRDGGGDTDSGPPTDGGPGGEDAGPDEDGGAPEDAGTEEDAGTAPACESVEATISNPHMHVMMVSAADVAAGTEREYEIRGTNPNHGHTVTVSAADFSMLAAGMTVMVTSTRDNGHTHMITLRCA